MAMDYECEIEIMEGEDKLLILCGSGLYLSLGPGVTVNGLCAALIRFSDELHIACYELLSILVWTLLVTVCCNPCGSSRGAGIGTFYTIVG